MAAGTVKSLISDTLKRERESVFDENKMEKYLGKTFEEMTPEDRRQA